MGITRHLGVGFVIASLLASGGAGAQIILDAPMFQQKKPEGRLPEVRAAPLAWPRLDPGAVLCRTEADLERLAARRQGQETSGPADCRVITGPTAVTILQRKGANLTQVQFTDAASVIGWTNVWLPEKAPGGATRQAGR